MATAPFESQLTRRHLGRSSSPVIVAQRGFTRPMGSEPSSSPDAASAVRPFIKKAKPTAEDELRPEYEREDFGPIVRGAYVAHLGRARKRRTRVKTLGV